MKSEKISIKWKIFIYLLSFLGILLILLWLFQTVYLDKFYKRIKEKELKNATDNILSVINDEDLETAINTIADRYDICVLIADADGNTICSAETTTGCTIHKMRQNDLKNIYLRAVENGGKLEEKIKNFEKPDMMPAGGIKQDVNDNEERPTDIENIDKYDKLPNMPNENESESIIKVRVVETQSGETYVVFLNSVITPVGATVHTLRVQLIYISGIMILLSLLIALIISKRVSKSIIRINDSAKELAKGNFDVKFDGKDYKEITELSETLNHTAKELSKSDVLQKELLANVSHDLRTPLTMITAYSEVMRDLPGENTPENVQVIIDETKRLTFLVNDLLDMSKIQAGVTTLETKEYDLTESINAAIERHSKLLEPYGYKVIFKYDRHVLVEADEFKIYQVIYNLIGNAVNYTGEDKKVIIKQIVENGNVRIQVIDSGEGIPKDKLENVWDRYYKIDKEHKRAIMGSGLGLSIVQNILKLHNAKYGVESEEGVGSTFWFELPVTSEVNADDNNIEA
ncbi:MAG: HAMP domain-containing sensor histidine kinase [Lachnospiraceae bacterium]|nr:HAMP domain-containing sensor histidine kinase [Lachnospiraceae bacterium]